MKNVCFIHSTNTPTWKDTILHELIDSLVDSGLMHQLEFVFVNNIGLPLTAIHPKVIVENYSSQLDLFENCTLRTLHAYAKIHPDTNILYLHTKGVSHDPDSKCIKGVRSWTKYMLYCLVEKHSHCLNLLKLYDTVGCNFMNNGFPPHYSGNFWWTTAKYAGTLSVENLREKHDAEFWLMQKNPLRYNIYSLENMYERHHDRLEYSDRVDHSFENRCLYCQFGAPGMGLFNQLYSLVNTMVIGKCLKGKTIIIVNDFLTDAHSANYCPAKEVLDLHRMNTFLERFGITLVGKRDCVFELISVSFGIGQQTVDLTDPSRFLSNKVFRIPRGTDLNDLCEDPFPGVIKTIYVKYKLNGHELLYHYDEYHLRSMNDLLLDFDSFTNVQWMALINIRDARVEKDAFDMFLSNISFLPKYENTAFIQSLPKKINLMHLRVEEDAIAFWSAINQMSCDQYRHVLEQKYIDLLAYIDPSSTTIILTMDTDNKVTRFMRDNGYKYVFMEKTLNGRELNAIQDYLMADYCNGVFIGNVNPKTYTGSTFSYGILNKLRNKQILKLCIDLDHIEASIDLNTESTLHTPQK